MFSSALILVLTVQAIGTTQIKPNPIAWSDVAKDVYIVGEIDRSAQVLISEETQRLALITPNLEHAVVLDLSRHTVSTTSKDSFRFYPDRVIALSDAQLTVNHAGNFKLEGESDYSFVVDAMPVRITTHQGLIGETTVEKVFETAPVWRSVMTAYQPDANAVAALKDCQPETVIIIALATWCPDSKKHVPRLVKSLDAAGNNRLRVKLVAIGRKFHEPAQTIKQHKIVHVPTVIVERNGVEVGRIVENPVSKTIEEDLAAILNGTPLTRKHK